MSVVAHRTLFWTPLIMKRRWLFRLVWAIGAVFAASAAAAVPIHGPLRVHPHNPRYFTDDSGRATLLVGSHTWNSLQDSGETDPPTAFDFAAYLDFLAQRDHNFIRLWRWELVSWNTKAIRAQVPRRLVIAPHPWARTGPDRAVDGKPKFDLERFDEGYFNRLRLRVEAARDRGVYVSVMLFEGWGLRFVPDGWKYHPFHPANNVNRIENDVRHVTEGNDLFSLVSPKVTGLQEAYVRKVIDTVNDLDNVLYEIANESDFNTTEWQYHLIRFIKKYESGKSKQHPVGMTSIGFGVDDLDRLLRSAADWISPNPDRFDYKKRPPAADGAKVILSDTDHLWGVGGNVQWVWKSVLRGLNPIFMDPYRHDVWDHRRDAQWERVRRAMGAARRVADRMRLAAMTPRPEFAISRYSLANPGQEYLVYLPAGGEVTLDLSSAMGPLNLEWINPTTGAATTRGTTTGGSQRSVKAPDKGDWVLHLVRKPSAP